MLNSTVNQKYEKKYLDNLKKIVLNKYKHYRCQIILFGSRAKGKYKRNSDYDIGISGLDDKLFNRLKYEIELEIEESIIPHSVDIINFDKTDKNFKKYALQEYTIWKN